MTALNIARKIKNIIVPPICELADLALERARNGEDVINLGQAIPGFRIPDEIISRVKSELDKSYVHLYSPDPGLPELREKISKKLQRDNNIRALEDEIIITAGANQAYLMLVLTLLEKDDEVILPSPFYFNHEMAIKLAEGVPVEVPLDPDEGYSISLERLRKKITKRTKIITLVNPNNPTGAVYSKEALMEIVDYASKNGIYVVSDETYEYFTYDDTRHYSPAGLPCAGENCITIGSFSKTYAMTGWRLGYIVASKKLIEEMMKVQDTMVICAPVISQIAGLAALELDRDFIGKRRSELERRRNIIRKCLDGLEGIKWHNPSGAFFGMLTYDFDISSFELARKIFDKTNVVTVAGAAFGSTCEKSLRLSFGAAEDSRLEEALGRLVEFFRRTSREGIN